MEEYNKTLRRMKQSGKIRDYLKCMPSIPSEVALFITEQVRLAISLVAHVSDWTTGLSTYCVAQDAHTTPLSGIL